jgi:hypothetical protein
VGGTYWEPGTNEKKSFPHPNFKGKKARHLECLPVGCIKFLFPKGLSPFLAQANTPYKEHPTYPAGRTISNMGCTYWAAYIG